MSREFEIIGAGAIGSLLRRKAKHAPPPGAACANCGTELSGPFCHACGQDADDHHRSIGHLAWEGVEGLTHLDGRLGQTLPLLLFQPGKLARDHLEGRRARHVPPFRLFLVSLLVFMFVLESLFHHRVNVVDSAATNTTPAASASQAAGGTESAADLAKADFDIDDDDSPKAQPGAVKTPAGTEASHHRSAINAWVHDHLGRALRNQEYYKMVLFTWAHRMAILLLPILAGLLALIYVRRRQFFIYDHLIVAMQFLSFEFLIFALAWGIPEPVRGWALLIATLWTPVNLYMTLRGAYGSRRITAGIKALFLWFSTLFLFSALMLGLLTFALAEM